MSVPGLVHSKTYYTDHVPLSKQDRNLELALYHANIIQQRKDVELHVLENMETLLDFPTSPNADSRRPSDKDIKFVKKALRLFQPSDFNSLIEERNINRKCGYTLCSNPNKLQNSTAKYVIVRSRGKSNDPWKYVDRKLLERWCSDDCAKRALYMQVQLDDEPAWERAGGMGGEIMLLEETRDAQSQANLEAQLSSNLENLTLSDGEEEFVKAMKELAIERGDRGDQAASKFGNVNVRENNHLGLVKAPEAAFGGQTDGSPESIEGYTPHRTGSSKVERPTGTNDDSEDENNGLSELVYSTEQ